MDKYLRFDKTEFQSIKITNKVRTKEAFQFMVVNYDKPAQSFPLKFYLEQNQPNPFSGKTIISYYIPFDTKVVIMLMNSDGYILKKLITNDQKAGMYEVQLALDELPEGTYFYQLITDKFTETRSMELIKSRLKII